MNGFRGLARASLFACSLTALPLSFFTDPHPAHGTPLLKEQVTERTIRRQRRARWLGRERRRSIAAAAKIVRTERLVLINADTDQPISGFNPLPDGAVLDLSRLPTRNLNIQARTWPRYVGSVVFSLDQNDRFSVEDFAPYALAHDTNGDYHPWTPAVGSHRITAQPWSHAGGSGTSGIPLTRTFTVIDGVTSTPTPQPSATPTPLPTNTPTPVPTATPTPRPSAMPTALPTSTPVSTPTSAPTSTPTAQPTGTATPLPTATSTPQPTATRTPVPTATPTSGVTFPPIPALSTWESNMRTLGTQFCNQSQIQSLGLSESNMWYYDGIRTYYRIADYTGNTFYNTCATYVRNVYQPYVLNNNGWVGGWRIFPHGLVQDWLRTGNQGSYNAALMLRNTSNFAATGGGADHTLSRETAYAIHAYLETMDLGQPAHPMLATAVNYALGHLNQWAVAQTASYVQPFMVGLTMEALINYYERTGDARIPPAIETAANWLWPKAWNSGAQAFNYMVCTPAYSNPDCSYGPSADLNLLIAPAYAWLYRRTGNTTHLTRGDAIFQGGVTGAWLGNGKQFNQNYRWSFDFVRWRQP